MARLRYSKDTLTAWAQDHPIPFGLWIACFDGLFAGFAFWLTSEIEEGRGLIVAGAVIVGILVAVAVLFLWAWWHAPIRNLRERVGELELQSEKQDRRIAMFIEEKYGDPLQFVPVYHQLRTDLREGIRIVRRARDTGELWSRVNDPDDGNWKKHKDDLGSHFWADQEVFGVLNEAFEHIARLTRLAAMRFRGGRTARPGDDLDAAIAAMEQADEALSRTLASIQGDAAN